MPAACANCCCSGNVRVAEADGARELLDGRRVAGQEMPARRGTGAAVLLQIRLLLCRRERRRVAGLKLTVTTSNSLPASNDSTFNALARPLSTSVHSIGHS